MTLANAAFRDCHGDPWCEVAMQVAAACLFAGLLVCLYYWLQGGVR